MSVFFCFTRLIHGGKQSIKTPIGWVGNKTSVLKILYAVFPRYYDRYIEPFGGSGAVLLGKPQRDRFEVYNDKNKNIVNLFRVIRKRPGALIQELGYHHLNSRDDFKVYKKALEKEEFTNEYMDEEMELTYRLFPKPEAEEIRDIYLREAEFCDVHRAAMFFLLIRFSYSSSCKSFGCQPCSIRGVFGLIWEMSRRLDGVLLENQDFEVLIKHYDRPGDFIYCDPPYFESEYVYDCGFSWEDHLRLRETLGGIEGKFLVSYNDCPEIRELYRGYEFFDFKRIHPMVQKYEAGRQFPELLIANYDLYEREKTKPRQISLLDDDSDSKAMERILRNGILQK